MKQTESFAYSNLLGRSKEVALLNSVSSHLHWDQQTYIPASAGYYRAAQISSISTLAHQRWTDQEVGEWLKVVENEEITDVAAAANAREWRRSYDRAVKLPDRLVEETARETSLAHEVWFNARNASDFSVFAPCLRRLLSLSLDHADCWGYEESPYDALIESYEPGGRERDLSVLFDSLAPELSGLVLAGEAASGSGGLPEGCYPKHAQAAFNEEVARAFGFDFSAGRVDTAAHPFCTTLGPKDIRLTTRYDETDFTSSLLGVLHEAGHGLYEQGLPENDFGLPSGTAVSLGIHESQSRLWENHIGRSLEFWQKWFPVAVVHFPQLKQSTPEAIFRHVNRVQRSWIRVEADEVTYDLHILLRFRIERALITKELRVEDLPAAWNAEFERLFGMKVPDDAKGCLQDVHWSGASFGYFPTYTLGNLNAASLFACASKEIHGLEENLRDGFYAPLLSWLRNSVHRHGSIFSPGELMERATGNPVSSRAYIAHLQKKVLALATL